MSDTVLVTGGFGLVGSEAVKQLAGAGRRVIATDLDRPAHREKAEELKSTGVVVRWTDLTDPAAVDRLISDTAPAAIIHLAAMIPPPIYRHPKAARIVNVDATASLVRAAEALPVPPRFLQASSNAVYGSRNPHLHPDPVRADTPPRPTDLYGGHKLEAEQLVRASRLPWVVLRLGGVMSVNREDLKFTRDALYFESTLPTDGRFHGVDVRDVATAFVAATTADVVGEILLIAGDESHTLRQGEVGRMLAAARGLRGVLPEGRPGNPDSEDDWFITDWMDTGRAQEALSFQHHSWPDMLAEMRARTGWKRYLMRPLVPFARMYVKRQGAYYKSPGRYADPWGAIREKLGEPGLDTAES